MHGTCFEPQKQAKSRTFENGGIGSTAGAAAAVAGLSPSPAPSADVQHGAATTAATEGGAASDADGGATVALSVAEKVAQEVAAAAQDRGFGDAEETALKGLSYKERLRLRMLVDVDPPSGSSIPFSDESNKLLLYGKELRCCCCVFWGWWLLFK